MTLFDNLAVAFIISLGLLVIGITGSYLTVKLVKYIKNNLFNDK